MVGTEATPETPTGIGEELAALGSDLRNWLEFHQGIAAGPPEGELPPPSLSAEEIAPEPVQKEAASEPAQDAAGGQADILFVESGNSGGEGSTEPLSDGPAAELLTKIINNVLRLERSDVAIWSASPALWQQIDAIRPKIVVALGPHAAQTLLDTQQSLEQLRGERHTVHGISLVATYHPTYLLSHPAQKRAVFEDMKLVRRLLEESKGRPLDPIARPGGAKS
jgi:hypothetical protein